jgi:hypothetical protein
VTVGSPVDGSARSVVREIDQVLRRLERWQKAAASEQKLLLSARAMLAERGGRTRRRRRVSQEDVASYVAEHPGSSAAEIADALATPATNVSTHLYRGRDTRFERRGDGWHLRASR